MAPFRIASPGIFTDIAAADYHADPCPTPSFTQSIAKLILDRSPRHAWAAHPRLNPKWVPDEDTKFNIGNTAHLRLLGRGKEIVIVDAPDWRTKVAQAMRDEAHAAGKVAVLTEQWRRAGEMVEAAFEQLQPYGIKAEDLQSADTGASEVTIAWREGETWFRSLIDRLPADCLVITDYKTTAASAAPQALDTKVAADGWAIQAAIQERGMAILDPPRAGRRVHRFICQENEYPYALTVSDLPEASMTMGRKMFEWSLERWRACMAIGVNREAWPVYDREIQRPVYPGWAETRWLDREIEEDERRKSGPMISVARGEMVR